MGTSLLYPAEVGWVQVLFLGTKSQKGSGENLHVLKELSNSVLHGRCIAMLFSIKPSWRYRIITQLKKSFGGLWLGSWLHYALLSSLHAVCKYTESAKGFGKASSSLQSPVRINQFIIDQWFSSVVCGFSNKAVTKDRGHGELTRNQPLKVKSQRKLFANNLKSICQVLINNQYI